jgi:glycosyltransferase involved in cell wall biosynthesis
MEKDHLIGRINQADVCLGAFGVTPQSLMTVQNKIYEAMAMGKPLISGDSPAVRQVFTHGEHIYLCERASGRALADAILSLSTDNALREKIAQNGYKLYKEKYDLLNNGKRFVTHLFEVIR